MQAERKLDSTISQHPSKEIVENSLLNLRSSISVKTPTFYFNPTSQYEINKIIKSLKAKDSSGYDEVASRILKLSSPYILPPLTHIINNVLRLGIFPDRLKYSVVRQLHKKGPTNEMENYRPISLLTTFAKVFEKVIHKRLYSFLKKISY